MKRPRFHVHYSPFIHHQLQKWEYILANDTPTNEAHSINAILCLFPEISHFTWFPIFFPLPLREEHHYTHKKRSFCDIKLGVLLELQRRMKQNEKIKNRLHNPNRNLFVIHIIHISLEMISFKQFHQYLFLLRYRAHITQKRETLCFLLRNDFSDTKKNYSFFFLLSFFPLWTFNERKHTTLREKSFFLWHKKIHIATTLKCVKKQKENEKGTVWSAFNRGLKLNRQFYALTVPMLVAH